MYDQATILNLLNSEYDDIVIFPHIFNETLYMLVIVPSDIQAWGAGCGCEVAAEDESGRSLRRVPVLSNLHKLHVKYIVNILYNIIIILTVRMYKYTIIITMHMCIEQSESGN